MKITIIITNSDRAGAQMHVLSLLKGLKNTHNFTVITGDEGFLTQEVKKLGVECYVIDKLNRSISPLDDFISYKSIFKLLKQLSPDLVHVHSAKAALLGRLAARKVAVKSIYTVHGWAFSEGNSFFKKAIALLTEKAMARFTQKFIVVSHYDREIALNRVFNTQDVTVIHNGIPIADTPTQQRNKNQKGLKLVCVARLSKQKNIPCLLRAISMIDSPISLDLIGGGPDEAQLKRYATDLTLDNKVNFLGERSDINDLLNKSDIFVLSSDWEGLPIAVIEAARASLPIVATDVGGVREIVKNGENGYLVARNDDQSLAQKLTLLIHNESKRLDFSKQSKQTFINHFQLEPMLKKTNDVYHAVAENIS